MITACSSLNTVLSSLRSKRPADSALVQIRAWSSRLQISAQQRKYVSAYFRWLRPHMRALAGVLALSLVALALQMVEPLFLRFIIDGVLLNDSIADRRVTYLNLAGATLLGLIVLSNCLGFVRDYWQRLVNVRATLTLRRLMFRRLLRLPLQQLSDMKTGGILSRLTGDVDSTSGLLNLAILLPATSIVRLLVALGVLVALNWRLALVALTLIPVSALISF